MAEEKPRETVVITVTGSDVLVQGEVVATVAQLLNEPGGNLDRIGSGPRGPEPTRRGDTANNSQDRREVTIMGDKAIPYRC